MRVAPVLAIVGVALTVATAALASEIGVNDFRISQMGPNGDASYSAISPAVAYNSVDDLFLVVWYGDHGTDAENEIYGRLIRSDGTPLAAQFRISDMGPNNDPDYDATNPDVAYNAAANEFLVVWGGVDDGAGFDGETEIFGQRLVGDTGLPIGANDFRISDAGPPGSPVNGASEPHVVHNSTANQYLVVWTANEGLGGLHNNEYEIYGQRLSSTGGAVGTNDFRISQVGPDGNPAYRVFGSAVTYNSTSNQYLVVWSGDDDTLPLVDNEGEIFGQRLLATGAAVGANDFRISDMGPNGDTDYGAGSPAVTHNPGSNEYLVVWAGDDNVASVDEEFEVFGQRLSATGGASGTNDFRISDMGPDGDTAYHGSQPALAYDPASGGYLVIWVGDDQPAPGVHETEAYGQQLSSTGGHIGPNDFRISDMGPDGQTAFSAGAAAVASADPNLVVWYGDDNTPPLVDNEYEIFGQLLDAAGGGPGAGEAVGLVDVSQGMWHLRATSGAITSFWYGNPGDLPLLGIGTVTAWPLPVCTASRTGSSIHATRTALESLTPNVSQAIPKTSRWWATGTVTETTTSASTGPRSRSSTCSPSPVPAARWVPPKSSFSSATPATSRSPATGTETGSTSLVSTESPRGSSTGGTPLTPASPRARSSLATPATDSPQAIGASSTMSTLRRCSGHPTWSSISDTPSAKGSRTRSSPG